MDFNGAIKSLQFYLDEQSFLQKIVTLKDLEYFDTPAVSLLLTQKIEVFHLPEKTLFKKGIFFVDDDWLDPNLMSMSKEKLFENGTHNVRISGKQNVIKSTKQNIIKSSIELFNNLINDKINKSGYWDLFNNCKELTYLDSILILKKNDESSGFYDILVIKGPMRESRTVLPAFLSSTNILAEFTSFSIPHTRPPRMEDFLSYRDLQKSTNLSWDMKQIRTFLGSIWRERTPTTLFSRLKLLFESTVLLAEKNSEFNKSLQLKKDSPSKVGIPSNFIIGICGGYARGEYSSKNSDLDMLLIHEGNSRQFLAVGETLDNILHYVPNLELCKIENLKNLNFHEDAISNILRAFLQGDETYLDNNQRVEVDEMLSSINVLRKTPLPPQGQKDGISKYCWSIYKSIINMVPIYEKPIGKGDYLRKSINQFAKKSLHELIPVLLRVTDSLNEEKNELGKNPPDPPRNLKNLKFCQPYVKDSLFKKYSTLTALQDVSTILAVLSETTFTSSTIDRFKVAMEKNIITEEQYNKFIQGYTIFSQIKYNLTDELPFEALEIVDDEMRSLIIEVYEDILKNLDPVELDEMDGPIAYPLLIFSDLHWGLNHKLAKQCLAEIKEICIKNQVRSTLIAGDVLNIDRVNVLEEEDSEGVSLLNELSKIQNSLGNQRIHIISGNHDPESFYKKFRGKIMQELDIHFIGNQYRDENIWVEHGDLSFWQNFTPPMDQYIPKFRDLNKLGNQKIIVGHNHRIYEEEKSGFYANGAIGKSFSSILVSDGSIELIKSPVEFSIDFDKIGVKYSEIMNADNSIDDFVQDNFDLVEWDKLTSDLGASSSSEKKTVIVTEKGVPTHIIPFNKVEDISKLNNIQVYEVAFPIHYIFMLGQTLKEAWEVFSVSGDTILPVINKEKQIVGSLSIFSVPKPEKEHSKTKEAEIDDQMESVGNFLTQKLFEKQKKVN
ncbi:MAG: metallophosphoesterase [Candidatus Hodarchaeales archaeon]